jgi:hypothetical protein
MTTWVMFFVMWGKFATSSVTVEFNSYEECEKGRMQVAQMIPSPKDGYFQYSACYEK